MLIAYEGFISFQDSFVKREKLRSLYRIFAVIFYKFITGYKKVTDIIWKQMQLFFKFLYTLLATWNLPFSFFSKCCKINENDTIA